MFPFKFLFINDSVIDDVIQNGPRDFTKSHGTSCVNKPLVLPPVQGK